MNPRISESVNLRLLCALFLCGKTVSGAHVQVSLTDFATVPQAGRAVILSPLQANRIWGANLVARDPVTNITDHAGQCVFSNVVAGSYQMLIAGAPATGWRLSVPETNDLVSASALVTHATPVGAGFVWDMRYPSVFGSGISTSMVSGRLRIDTASGGGGPTNGIDACQATNIANGLDLALSNSLLSSIGTKAPATNTVLYGARPSWNGTNLALGTEVGPGTNAAIFFAATEFFLGAPGGPDPSYGWVLTATNAGFVWHEDSEPGGEVPLIVFSQEAPADFPNGIAAPRIKDATGSLGSPGQVLTATAAGSAWSNAIPVGASLPAPDGAGKRLYTDGFTNALWNDDSMLLCVDESFKTPASGVPVSGMNAGGGGGASSSGIFVNVPYSFPGGDRLGWYRQTVWLTNTACRAYGFWSSGSSGPSAWWRANSLLACDFVLESDWASPLTNLNVMVGVMGSAIQSAYGDSAYTDGIYLRLLPDVNTNWWAVCKRAGASNAVDTGLAPMTNQLYQLRIFGSTNWTRLTLNEAVIADFFQQGGTNDPLPTGQRIMPFWWICACRTNLASANFWRLEIDRFKFRE